MRSLLLIAVCLLSAMSVGADERAKLTGEVVGEVVTDVPAPDRLGEDWPCFLGPKGTGECSEVQWLKK